MLALTACLCLCPQVTSIPLETDPLEADWLSPLPASFSPDGTRLILASHRGALVDFDVAGRTGVERSFAAGWLDRSTFTPGGSRVVVVSRSGLTVRSFPGLNQVSTGPGAVGVWARVAVNPAGTEAVLVSHSNDTRALVVDLATGDELRPLFLSGSLPSNDELMSDYAADGVSFVIAGNRRIRTFDTGTGQVTANALYGPDRKAIQMLVSPDRTQVTVAVGNDTPGTERVELDVYALPSLTLISRTPTGIPSQEFFLGMRLTMDDSGTLAVLADRSNAWAVDPVSGATTEIPLENETDALLTADGSMIAAVTEDRWAVFDSATLQSLGQWQLPRSAFLQRLLRHPALPLVGMVTGGERLDIVERLPGEASDTTI